MALVCPHSGRALAALTLLFAVMQVWGEAPTALRGRLSAHDPSRMVQCKDRYYIFSTGLNIPSKSSSDKILWTGEPAVFRSPPAWTTNAVPGFNGVIWAPDVFFYSNQYYLYYAISTRGSQVSAIGLATNPTLDPNEAAYHWTDKGAVIQSSVGYAYNAIDPSFVWDVVGNLWMAFGSYWNGIYIVQLDPATGLRISPTSPLLQVAAHDSVLVEASYIYRHDPYYYLFVNWGLCCKGVDSTYEIRVGRSTNVTGPYLDRNGVNLQNGGGTPFIQGSGKYVGPGHFATFLDGTNEWFTFHYYDANAWTPLYTNYGNPTLGFAPLSWTADNWPTFRHDWSALYSFETDAADQNKQFHGLLKGGASIRNDAVHGHVLDLNGAGQYVWLPPGVANGRTFVAVVKWRGGGPWQRIFDFGFSTNHTFMLTPASGANVLRCDIYPNTNSDLKILQWNKPLPTNVWTHVAVTLNGTRGILYVNGSAVATNTSMHWLPLDVAPRTNHLGRSKFIADPDFNGQIASFRSYARALSPAEIVAPLPQISEPRTGATWEPGTTIHFAGIATDFADVQLGSTNLSWTITYSEGDTTNVVFGPASGIERGVFTIPSSSTGTGIYNVVLSANDRTRQNSAVVSLSPGNGNSDWSSFYPFTGNAHDESNRFNGVIVGARIEEDALQGSVLNLSASNQYVNLPSAAGSAQTVACWVNWRGGEPLQRVFAFGRDSNHVFSFTPQTATASVQCSIVPDGQNSSRLIETPFSFPVNRWTHVAAVMDGRQGILYVNGEAVAVNNSVNTLPADLLPDSNFLGGSHSPTDPFFEGELDSVYLSSRVLSSSEINSLFLRPSLSASLARNEITISWPQWAFRMQLYETPTLSPSALWTFVSNSPVVTTDWVSVTLPGTNRNIFYRLQWP
jgi:arabinan endo-1,5-alpha-L-arabinosidase